MQGIKQNNADFWTSAFCISKLISSIAIKNNRNPTESKKNSVASGSLNLTNPANVNVDIFTRMISSETLKVLAGELVLDMYEFHFDNCSSVNPNFVPKKSRKNMLGVRKSVSLLEHTFGTVNQMNLLIGKSFGVNTDFFLILALVHDYGKCENLKEEFQIVSSLSHNEASRVYLEKVATNKNEISSYYHKLFGSIYRVLDAHHNPTKQKEFYALAKEESDDAFEILLLTKLQEADFAQRQIEEENFSDV